MRRIAGLAAAAVVLAAVAVTHRSAEPATGAIVPVVVVVMENHEYGAIVGSGSAPYVNDDLIPAGRLFTSYHAITHPSLPNYLAMTAGQTLCADNGCARPFTSADSIFRELRHAKIGWRAYEESMPSNCYRSDSGDYAVRHNPPPYFSNIVTACGRRDVPYPSSLPSRLRPFTFVTPNLCDDMHDCSVSVGDAWLSDHVPDLLAKGAIVVVVFDEGSTSEGGGGHVFAEAVGPGIAAGETDSNAYDHFSLLAGIEDHFSVPRIANAVGKNALPL